MHGNHIPTEPRPCWWCVSFVQMTAGDTAALCRQGGARSVRAMPQHGCVFYMRATGADDEPGPPASADVGPSVVRLYMPPVKPLEWAP